MKYRIEVTSGCLLFRQAWKREEETAGQTIHMTPVIIYRKQSEAYAGQATMKRSVGLDLPLSLVVAQGYSQYTCKADVVQK